jgi:SAM-dependent methyltransferase
MNSALPQAIDWEARWQQGKIPWDHGEPSQALVDLLQEGADLIPDQGTVLVPGCGSGYDVYLLAESSPERKVIGLDLSKTCIDQCNKVNGGIQS